MKSSSSSALRARFAQLVERLRSPTAIYLMATVLARLGSFVLLPIYTRRLSPAAYGDYAVAQTIISVLPTVMSLGLLSAISKAYFGTPDRVEGTRAAANVAAWSLTLVAGFMILLLGAASLFGESGGATVASRWLLTCCIIAAAGSAATQIPSLFFRTAQRPYAAALTQLVEFGAIASSGILLVGVCGRGLQGAVEAYAVAYGACGLASAFWVFFRLRGRPGPGVLRASLVFALPFVPHFLANWSQLAADRWVLKYFHLEGALGNYALAVQLSSPASMAAIAFHDSESARIGELFRTGGLSGLSQQFSRIQFRYFLAALLPCLLVAATAPLAGFALGPAFRSALGLVPALLALVLVDSLYFPASNAVYFAGNTRVIPVVTVLSAAVNVLANLILIPRVGIYGAVISRGLSYLTRGVALGATARISLARAARSSV